MTANKPVQNSYEVNITGGVSGQVAVGSQILQVNRPPSALPTAQADLEGLAQALNALKEQILELAPAEKQPAALERVDELAGAITDDQPDLTTMEYVRSWFTRNLPGLAGAVTGLIVNPIVGRVVEAAGELVASEFRRRFGVA